MQQRPFANTGKNVSLLGLGTVKFGRNRDVKYPGGEGFPLPTDVEIETLLDLAIECGINLLDTAPAYGTSEERLGKLMGARREKFFLVSKTGEEFDGEKSERIYTAEHTRLSVERSLKRLGVDHIESVLVHCGRDDIRILTETPVFETLARLKDEGKIGSFGASTYTIEAGKIAVDRSDCVMVSYNAKYLDEKPVIDYALQKGKAVLVKKGLASGHVGTLGSLEENIRFVTETPGVTSLVFGSLNPANIRANVAAASGVRAAA
jgi:aryl-alcohol dehydrogenase-like predicted oxidoreductase